MEFHFGISVGTLRNIKTILGHVDWNLVSQWNSFKNDEAGPALKQHWFLCLLGFPVLYNVLDLRALSKEI